MKREFRLTNSLMWNVVRQIYIVNDAIWWSMNIVEVFAGGSHWGNFIGRVSVGRVVDVK